MDINQIFEQAKQRGLNAINSIKSTLNPSQPYSNEDIGTQVAREGLKIINARINPLESQFKPLTIKPYEPIKSVISVNFMSQPSLLIKDLTKPEPITTQPAPQMNLRPSELIFGEWAKQGNNFVNNIPNTFKNNLNNSLSEFKANTELKLQQEIDRGQGDTFQANNLRNSINYIDTALNSDSLIKKYQVNNEIGRLQTGGNVLAGNVQTGKNIWSVGVSLFDNATQTPEQKAKVSQAGEVVQDKVSNFLDNVLADLRPAETKSTLVDRLVESAGGMAGMMYVSALAGGSWAANLLASSIESLGEGGSTYDTNRKNGMSVQDAFNREMQTIGSNFVLNYITNKFTGIFDNVPNADLKTIKSKILNTIGVGAGEGFQEFGQQVISNLATNRPVDEGALESFGFGFVIGGGINTVKLRNNNTGEIVATVKVKPQVIETLTNNAISKINLLADKPITLTSSETDMMNSYESAFANAMKLPDPNGVMNELNSAFQILNSYNNAYGKIRAKSVIDPNGEMTNEQFAQARTEKGLVEKEKATGIDRNVFKQKIKDVKNSYVDWVNNVETSGKILQEIDYLESQRLGRPLKPSESLDVWYDRQFQLNNIVQESPQFNDLRSIFSDLNKNKLNLDEFGQYLESRRNLALSEIGVKKDVNVAEESRTVAGFNQKYAQYADRFYKVMDSVAEMLHREGLITTEVYTDIIQNKDYAPFYNIYSQENRPGFFEAAKRKLVSIGKQTVVKNIESTKKQTVENPAIMSVPYLYSAYAQILKNQSSNAIVNGVKSGLIQRNGYAAKVLQTAEDARLRKLVKDEKPTVEKTINKITNQLRKDKKATRKFQSEVNKLTQEAIKISNLNTEVQVDDTYINKIAKMIQNRFGKIDVLEKEAEQAFQGILKAKQTGEEVLKDNKYQNKTNRMIDTREQWVSDLADIGADILTKKGKNFMKESNQKFPNKKDRREFFKTATTGDIYDFINEMYNLPDKDFQKMLSTATTKNLKIKSVLEDIDSIKKAQITNNLVNAIIQLPSEKIDQLYEKYNKTQTEIGKVLRDVKSLTDASIINSAVNSLIQVKPDILIEKQKELDKKYPILDKMIQTVIDEQNRLDEETGYNKRLKEIEKQTQAIEADPNMMLIEALHEGYTEKVAVDRRLGESLVAVNNPEYINNILNFFSTANQILKGSVIAYDPAAAIRLFGYDQQFAAMLSEKPLQTSMLNLPTFGRVLVTTLLSGPYARKFAPKALQASIAEWDDWQRNGGATSELFVGNKESAKKWAKSGGKNEISLENAFKFVSKLDLIQKFQIYTIYKQNYLSQGWTEEEAGIQAAYDSRNTLPNIHRRTQFLKILDIVKPFQASMIQSGAKLRDQLKKHPERTVDRLMYPAAVYALAMLWNLSSEERRKAWAGIPEWKKNSKFILLTDYLSKDGVPYYINVSADQSVMGLLQGVRKTIEGMASLNGKELFSGVSDFIAGLWGIKIPTTPQEVSQELGSTNPVVSTMFDLNSNYNSFTGRPIVPQSLQNKYNYLKYDENTTNFAKWYGKKFDVAPLKVDYALKKFFGNIPNYIDSAFNKVTGNTATESQKTVFKNIENTLQGLFISDQYGADVQKLWADKTEADLKKDELNTKISQALSSGDIETAKKLADGNVTKAQWLGLENSYQANTLESTLTGKEKAYYNMPNAYLQTLKKQNPEEASTIDKVIALKKSATKLPNIDTAGIKFLPSGTGGTGPSLSIKKLKAPSLKATGTKGPRIAKPSIKAPKKPKALKIKKLKAPKFAKIKPLKKVKRF